MRVITLQILICVINPSFEETGRKIFNGNQADIAEFPFMVKLDIYFDGKNGTCAGTYVAALWVLTAAHCVDFLNSGNSVELCMGSAYAPQGKCGASVRKVIKIIIPGKATPGRNDLAMLKISEAFSLGANVQYAKLPKKVMNIKEYSSEMCMAAGWGLINNKRQLATNLLKASVEVRTFCPIALRICVYTHNQGPCQGDSGSPLICKGIVVGVLSTGNTAACGPKGGTYDFYVRVDLYRTFIKDVISGKFKAKANKTHNVNYNLVVLVIFLLILS